MSVALTGLGPQYAIAGGGVATGVNIGMHNSNSINLNVTKATGGWVVSLSSTSGFTTTSQDLHIIPDGADLGTELGKLITMHCLKE
jgi:hypothetical protein